MDEQQQNPQQKFPHESLAWLMWTPAALFYLYEFVLRVSPSVMTHSLMESFGVQSAALGVLASFYYYSYVPLQIPCGVIVDWLGPRIVVTMSALLCAVGSLLFAQSESMAMAEVARFLIGAGSACAYISCAKVGAEWFRAERFAVVAGVTMMMGTLGGTFGGRPFAILVNKVGWRESMVMGGYAGFIVAGIAWAFIRSRKQEQKVGQKSQTTKKAGIFDGLRIIASNPQSWLIGLYGGLMYVPISAFAELWGVPYLMKSHNISNEMASMASAMMFIGMALGSPIGAALSNRLKSRLKVMGGSALLTAIPFAMVVYIPGLSLPITYVLLFLAGLASGGQILYFAASQEINPPEFSASTVGFTNSLVMVNGIITQPLLGHIMDLAWDGQVNENGTPFYSIGDYQQAMTTIPVCLILAWCLLKFVKETFPKESQKN